MGNPSYLVNPVEKGKRTFCPRRGFPYCGVAFTKIAKKPQLGRNTQLWNPLTTNEKLTPKTSPPHSCRLNTTIRYRHYRSNNYICHFSHDGGLACFEKVLSAVQYFIHGGWRL
jgi:hypothetical protein